MKLLSYFSPNRHGGGRLAQPGDARLLELGVSAWRDTLAEAGTTSVAARAWSRTKAGQKLLAALFGNSPFLAGVAVREWAFLTRIVENGPDTAFAAIVAETATPPENETQPELMQRLRIARRRHALTVAVADIAGAWDLERQMRALTGFAEAAIDAALHQLLLKAATDKIIPVEAARPEKSGLIVLGMGKLGGGELNYSSDIDLILLYDLTSSAAGA